MKKNPILPEFKVLPSAEALAASFAEELAGTIRSLISRGLPVFIALSGGSTPLALFRVLSGRFSGFLDWTQVHFFWVDERCVPPEDSESNFGNAKKELLKLKDLPPENFHRIRGELEPLKEAERYESEIRDFVRKQNGWPQFDIVLLGMGDDGHTASIFPGNLALLNSGRICEYAQHPVTGQGRITLTGKVINNSALIFFLVTGKSKAPVVAKVFNKSIESRYYPVTFIEPINGHLKWFLDSEAASMLNNDQSC